LFSVKSAKSTFCVYDSSLEIYFKTSTVVDVELQTFLVTGAVEIPLLWKTKYLQIHL